MMRTGFVSISILLASLMSCALAAYRAPLHQTEDAIRGQYIVVLKDQYGAKGFIKKMAAGNTTRHFDNSSITWVYTKALNGFAANLTQESLEEILSNEAVKYVSEDGVVEKQAVTSWGLDRINQRYLPLDGNEDHFGTGGEDVNIYVIDTGIYPDSIYFSGRARPVFDAFGRDGIDCDGHGTHCAGIAGGEVFGVARNAYLLGVRVLNCNGRGSASKVIAGYDYVAEYAVKPAVASASLGGRALIVEDEAVRNLIATGVTTVVAAGNEYTRACKMSPARVEEAITVGATNRRDSRVNFSNYGKCVDIYAPGEDIPSAGIDGEEEIVTKSGTSMATPFVTGVVALQLGLYPDMTPAEIKSWLFERATPDVLRGTHVSPEDRLLFSGEMDSGQSRNVNRGPSKLGRA